MKVITLQDPWASLVRLNEKKIETRSWKTNYRGPLLIHASKKSKKENLDLAYREPFFSSLKPQFIKNSDLYYPGCIIAKCNLVDCLEIKISGDRAALLGNNGMITTAVEAPELCFGNYTPGRFAWILEDIEPLENPIPAKGQLGLWEFDLEGALKNV
jgi:hypothetical protein